MITLDKNEIGKSVRFTDYTIDDVITAAREHLAQTGRRPSQHSGMVQFGTKLTNKIAWKNIHQSSILKNAGYSSLADLLDKHGIAKTLDAPQRLDLG